MKKEEGEEFNNEEFEKELPELVEKLKQERAWSRNSLIERSARLESLIGLKAPKVIVLQEIAMVQDAIAGLLKHINLDYHP